MINYTTTDSLESTVGVVNVFSLHLSHHLYAFQATSFRIIKAALWLAPCTFWAPWHNEIFRTRYKKFTVQRRWPFLNIRGPIVGLSEGNAHSLRFALASKKFPLNCGSIAQYYRSCRFVHAGLRNGRPQVYPFSVVARLKWWKHSAFSFLNAPMEEHLQTWS